MSKTVSPSTDRTAKECKHEACTPLWDADAAAGMSTSQVRINFPRFNGRCPDCQQQVIVYADYGQYIGGDY